MKFSMSSAFMAMSAIALVAAIPTTYPVEGVLRTVHQFPNRTWIENFAIRKNGQILGNDLITGRIYLVDPKNPIPNPPIVAQLPQGFNPTGIVEVEPDIFYAQGAMGSPYNFTFEANTSAIYRIDMTTYSPSTNTGATLTQAATLPLVQFPNGMATLSRTARSVLVGDAAAGVVWRVDLDDGSYEMVLDGPNLSPVPGGTPIGVNGLLVTEGEGDCTLLHFASTTRGLLVKVPIDPVTGRARGEQVVVSSQVAAADDFTLDGQGNYYVALNVRQTVIKLTPGGEQQVIAGGQNSTELRGPVSVRFGRTGGDRDVLYISTDDLSGFDQNREPRTSAGKISAIRV